MLISWPFQPQVFKVIYLKRAALLAMAAALKEKHQLEAQEEQIRQKKELLELQSQIAAHTAKVTVLKYRGSDIQSSRAHSDGMNSYLESSKRKSFLRPSAMEFVPQNSNHQFSHPPKGGSKAVVPVETRHKDSNHQINHPPIGGSKATGTMGERPKETILQQVGPKAHALNPKPSMPQRTQQTHHTQEFDTNFMQESIQHAGLVQTNMDQGNLLTIMQRLLS